MLIDKTLQIKILQLVNTFIVHKIFGLILGYVYNKYSNQKIIF